MTTVLEAHGTFGVDCLERGVKDHRETHPVLESVLTSYELSILTDPDESVRKEFVEETLTEGERAVVSNSSDLIYVALAKRIAFEDTDSGPGGRIGNSRRVSLVFDQYAHVDGVTYNRLQFEWFIKAAHFFREKYKKSPTDPELIAFSRETRNPQRFKIMDMLKTPQLYSRTPRVSL